MNAMTLRRRVLWGLLAAKVVAGCGLVWDIRWHVLVGRDSFWIPPHVMTYAGVTALVILSLGILLAETAAARRHRLPGDSVRVAGLVGTRGFHLAWWAIVLTILAAPIDDLWHRLFGIDVTLWSPPHLLGLVGGLLNTLGCLLIALEVYAPASRARLAALLLGGALLFGGLHITLTPSVLVAFLQGGLFFFTYAILGGGLFTFALVLTAKLSGLRGAPLLVVAGGVLVMLSMLTVSSLGFALIQPVSHLQEAIAADPTSPIALAHEIARRNGTTPGFSLRLQLFPLLPAALMAVVDARRRWRAASLTFGLALVTVTGVMFSRAPALAHALPSASDSVLAAALTAAAALLGGWLALRLADLVVAPAARTTALSAVGV